MNISITNHESPRPNPSKQNDRPGNGLSYVIITPAWNEAEFIGLTLQSMVNQTVLPVRWVIVSDGSTDGTDDIVREYAERHDWIELVRLPERSERHFAGKVYAVNSGYARLRDLEFDIVGNVDADISFGPDLFEFLLARFKETPQLGVAGTEYREDGFGGYNYAVVNIEDVTGHCQLFRRDCFEKIGGYVPIRHGGIDSVAVIAARMNGWKTRTFTERCCMHHRKVGTAKGTYAKSYFMAGKKDYYGGGHPLWTLFRSIYHLKHKPYLLGGLLLFSGYLSGLLARDTIPLSPELIQYRRREQMLRLKTLLKRTLGLRDGQAQRH